MDELIQNLNKGLRIDEGVRYVPYLDSKGIPTIGVGHNTKSHPLPPNFNPPLTDDQVNTLLSSDIDTVFNDLDVHCRWWRTLNMPRQYAICNMCFNLGIVKLLGFKHFLSALQSGDYNQASIEMMDSEWFHQVGKRAERLFEIVKTGKIIFGE